MTIDVLDQLRAIRPDTDDLGRRWPADARALLASTIQHDELSVRVSDR